MSTSQKLLSGSDRLNKKQDDIIRIIKMVTGALKGKQGDSLRIHCEHDTSMWEVWWDCRNEPRIVLHWDHGVIYSNTNGFGINVRHIQRVYDVLDEFVDRMMRDFPEVQHKLAPVLKAAENK